MTDGGDLTASAGTQGRLRERLGASSIAGQTAVILASRVIGAVSTGVLTVILARLLGLDGYGNYALALTIAMSAALVASLGLDSATARYVADGYNSRRTIAGVILRGLRLRTLLAGTVFGLLIVLANPISSLFGEPGLAGAVRAAAVALFFSAGFQWVTGVYEGVRRGGMLALMSIVKAVVEFAVVLTVLLLGFGVVGALVGNAVSYAVAVGVGLFMMRPYLARDPSRPALDVSTGTILRYGNHIWLAGVAWILFDRVDQILLGIFLGTDAVGLYDAPWRIATLLGLLGLSIASAVTPRVASGDPEEAGRLLTKALRVTIVFYVVLGCITAVAAGDVIVGLLGPEFARSVDVLRALLPYLALMGLAPVLSRALDFIGVAAARKWIALATFLVNLVLDLILIPTIGLLGPAIATDVAILTFVAGHYALCTRRLSLDSRALTGTVVRSCIAAGAGATVCFVLLQIPGPDLVLVAIAFPVAILASLAVLLALKETTAEELHLPGRIRTMSERVFGGIPNWRAGAASPGMLLPVAAAFVAVLMGGAIGHSPALVLGAVVGLSLVALLLSDITIGVTAFVLVQPLVVLGGVQVGDSTITKGAGAILLLTWAVSLFYPSARRRYLSLLKDHPYLTAALLMFMAWGMASMLWAINRTDTIDALQRWALGFLLIAIVFTAAHSRRAAIIIAGAFATSAVASTVLGIAEGNTTQGRLNGTLTDANEFASFCVPALLIAAALASTAKTPLRRVLFAGGALVCGLGIVLSGSRGGLVAIAAALVAWILFGGRWRKRVLVASLIVGIVGFAAIATVAPPQVRDRLGTITQDQTAASSGGGTGRTDIWAVGLRAYDAHPVAGSGLGNFTDATPRYLTEPGLIHRTDFFTTTPKVAHNTYLHILVEVGQVGLGLFLLILLLALAAAARGARNFRRAGDRKMELLTRTLLAGTIGLLAADFFISGQYQRTLWILLGLCVAFYSLSKHRPAEAARGPRPRAEPEPRREMLTPVGVD